MSHQKWRIKRDGYSSALTTEGFKPKARIPLFVVIDPYGRQWRGIWFRSLPAAVDSVCNHLRIRARIRAD